MQVTVRLLLRLQIEPPQALHRPHGPVAQTPSTGSFPVQACDDAPAQLPPPHPGVGLVQARVCVPLAPQAVAEQALHADQPPFRGPLPVQVRDDAPAQPLPPHAGVGLVQARVCVPLAPQAVAEHALQSDQPPSTRSLPPQARDDGPEQTLPPQPGAGLSQVRVCVPVAPQTLTEQALQLDQPPSTAAAPVQARVSFVPLVPSSFRHSWPPRAGTGSLQVRVCVPPAPQAVAEQALQSDQPPSTAMNLRHFSEFSPPCRPSQRQR